MPNDVERWTGRRLRVAAEKKAFSFAIRQPPFHVDASNYNSWQNLCLVTT